MVNETFIKKNDCLSVQKTKIDTEDVDYTTKNSLIDNPNIKIINYCVFFKLFMIKFSILTFYYSIIRNESNLLIKDIEITNQRFISNSYLRFNNEMTILIKNVMDVNNEQCAIMEALKYTNEPQLITNFIQEESNKILKNATIYHFIEKYMSSFKDYVGINGELNEMIEYMKNEPIMEAIDLDEKYNLRGFHKDLDILRVLYNDLKKQKFEYKIYETETETVDLFLKQINVLFLNPHNLYCNDITNKNQINLENFKENVIIMNSISIKDWTTNIFHPIKGIIATRIQNTVVKTIYFNILLLCLFIIRFLKNHIFSKIPRID
jgi:hypothetical protein